jgi:hypothetical protein
VKLIRGRSQRLCKQFPLIDKKRKLAAASAKHPSACPDQITLVEADKSLKGLWPQHITARMQLEQPGPIDEVQKRCSSVASSGGQTPGHPVYGLGLLPGFKACVSLVHPRDRRWVTVAMRKWIYALLS